MQRIVHNPDERIYPATPDYVHALEIHDPQRIVYLSGTMGLDTAGAAGRNLSEQLDLCLVEYTRDPRFGWNDCCQYRQGYELFA